MTRPSFLKCSKGELRWPVRGDFEEFIVKNLKKNFGKIEKNLSAKSKNQKGRKIPFFLVLSQMDP